MVSLGSLPNEWNKDLLFLKGPRPSDDAINAFVEFFEAPDLQTAQDAFVQSCKEIDVEPFGAIMDFYVKYKVALKEHVPYKYREIWKILDKKMMQKPYLGWPAEKANVLVCGAGPCGLRYTYSANSSQLIAELMS